MKRFKFRLQRVLDYRKLVKDERLRDLLDANYKVELSKTELDQLETAASKNEIEQGKSIDSSFIFLRGIYGLWLKDSIQEQREDLSNAEEAAEKSLLQFIESAKDVKALDLLKERKTIEYKQSAEAEDIRFLDEISVQKGNTFIE